MQELNACSRSGSDTKCEPRCDPCGGTEFHKFSDDCYPACGIADDVGSRCAATASGIAGSCGGSATSSTSSAAGEDYCSGRDCGYSDGD